MDTPLAFFQAKWTLDGIVFHDSPLDRFPAIAGFNKINHAVFRFIHTLDAGERFFVHPCRNIRQLPCIRHANNFLITVSRFSPFLYLSNRTMTNTGTIFTIPKLNRLAFVCYFQNIDTAKPICLLWNSEQPLFSKSFQDFITGTVSGRTVATVNLNRKTFVEYNIVVLQGVAQLWLWYFCVDRFLKVAFFTASRYKSSNCLLYTSDAADE